MPTSVIDIVLAATPSFLADIPTYEESKVKLIEGLKGRLQIAEVFGGCAS